MSVCVLRVGCGTAGGHPVEDNDSVGQVGGHDEVVLHHEGRLLRVEDVPTHTHTGARTHTVLDNVFSACLCV